MKKLLWITLGGISLGATAVVSRIGVLEVPAIPFVTLRLLVALAIFVPILVLLRVPLPRDRKAWVDIGIVGVTTTAPLLAFTYALNWISAGVLAVFLSLVPLFAGIQAHLILAHEKLTRAKVVGLAIAFAGVALILVTRTSGLQSVSGGGVSTGHALALAGSVVAAYSGVHIRRTLVGVPALAVTTGQIAISLVLLVPIALALGGPAPASISGRAWLAIAFTGLLGSTFAFWLLTKVAQEFGATAAAQPGYIMPLVSTGLGAAMLGEQLGVALLGGGVLILAGLYLANR